VHVGQRAAAGLSGSIRWLIFLLLLCDVDAQAHLAGFEQHLPVAGHLDFDAVANLPSAHDYDRSLWSSSTEVNHARAEQAGLTAEVVTVISTPLNSTSLCFLVESAVRQGYRVTVLTIPKKLYSNHEKERLSSYYGRLQRERILQEQLGVANPRFNLANYTKLDLLALVRSSSNRHDETNKQTEKALVEYLVAHPHLYLFADAFDVLVQLSPIELHKRVRANWPVEGDTEEFFIVSGEANQWPQLKSNVYYPDRSQSLFPFVNSGMWVARLDRMISFTEHISNATFKDCHNYLLSFSDQCKMMIAVSDPARRFTEFPVHRDVNATTLQSMAAAPDRRKKDGLSSKYKSFHAAVHLGMTPEGLISRRDIPSTPLALHWNGKAKGFNPYQQTVSVNTTAVDLAVYTSLGWMRRPISPGGERPFYFHVTHAELKKYLTFYDENLQVSTVLLEGFFQMCTSDLGSTFKWDDTLLEYPQKAA